MDMGRVPKCSSRAYIIAIVGLGGSLRSTHTHTHTHKHTHIHIHTHTHSHTQRIYPFLAAVVDKISHGQTELEKA